MSSSGPHDVVIVGGGHNGLVASFYLARAGLKTLVLERRPFVGGACITEEFFEGYRVSSCSYLCWFLQPKVHRDMRLAEHGLRTERIDPHMVNLARDGSQVSVWVDEAQTQSDFAARSQADADAYPEFEAYWTRAAKLLEPFLLQDPPRLDEVRQLAKSRGEEDLLYDLLTSSIADVCGRYFSDPLIQSSVVTTIDVGDPWAPGSAFAEAYFRCGDLLDWGHSVVEGGMGSITQAMAAAAQAEGVEIRTDAEVAQILVEGNRVRGVALVSGETIEAPIVLSNADPKRTYLRLLDEAVLPADFRQAVSRLSTRAAYMKLHTVMDELPDISGYFHGSQPTPEQAAYIRIGPSLDHYRRSFNDAVSGVLPREPICHLQIPTVYDRTLTNGDGHVVSVWVMYAPVTPAEGTWEERRQEAAEHVIDYITGFVPNFRDAIRGWTLLTPEDMEERVGLTNGSIHHLDHIPSQMLDARPLSGTGYGSPVEGLYLCGAGTHPGGEVTGAPGHNAAHHLLERLHTEDPTRAALSA
jgi:phytoene dehydrogenase-like protein